MKFPLWITIKYFVRAASGKAIDQKIVGHRFSASSEKHLVEMFKRNQWDPVYICELEVNGTILPEDRREKFYIWLSNITEKVREENETRKETDKESTENHDGSRSQSG